MLAPLGMAKDDNRLLEKFWGWYRHVDRMWLARQMKHSMQYLDNAMVC